MNKWKYSIQVYKNSNKHKNQCLVDNLYFFYKSKAVFVSWVLIGIVNQASWRTLKASLDIGCVLFHSLLRWSHSASVVKWSHSQSDAFHSLLDGGQKSDSTSVFIILIIVTRSPTPLIKKLLEIIRYSYICVLQVDVDTYYWTSLMTSSLYWRQSKFSHLNSIKPMPLIFSLVLVHPGTLLPVLPVSVPKERLLHSHLPLKAFPVGLW